MAAGGLEHEPRQRHQQHIADLAGHVGHHPGEHNYRREKHSRRSQHQQAQCSADKAGVLGHADANQRHQHGAQRCETGEVGHQTGEDAVQAVDAQQVDRADHLAAGRMRYRQIELRGDSRQDDHQHGEEGEQRRWVWQGIAPGLDNRQEAVDRALA